MTEGTLVQGALPDLDELLEEARTLRAAAGARAAQALAEVEQLDGYIERLTGRKQGRSTRTRRTTRVSEATYKAVLTELSKHSHARAATLKQCGASESTVCRSMNVAVQRGHADRTKRGHGYRYTITQAGVEYVTRPDARAA